MPYTQLTMSERHIIDRLHLRGYSQATIARATGRSPSTVSRELQRNHGSFRCPPLGHMTGYIAGEADRKARARHAAANAAAPNAIATSNADVNGWPKRSPPDSHGGFCADRVHVDAARIPTAPLSPAPRLVAEASPPTPPTRKSPMYRTLLPVRGGGGGGDTTRGSKAYRQGRLGAAD